MHSNRINIRQNPLRRFQLLCNVKLAINPKCPGNKRIFCPSLPERDALQRAAAADNTSSAAIREVCGTPMALSLVLRAIYFFSLSRPAALSRFHYFMCIRRENNNPADLTFSAHPLGGGSIIEPSIVDVIFRQCLSRREGNAKLI